MSLCFFFYLRYFLPFRDNQTVSVTCATFSPELVGRSPFVFFSLVFFWERFGVQFLSPPLGGGRSPHTAGFRCSFKGWLPCFSSGSAHPYFSLLPRCFKVSVCFFLFLSLWDRFLFDSHSQTHKLCLTPGAGGATQLWHRWRRSDDDGTVLCFLLYTFVLLPVVCSDWGNMHTTVLWALDWDCAVAVFMEQKQRHSTKWQSAL